MSADSANDLVAFWREQFPDQLHAAATAAQLAAFESLYHVRLPQDFRSYFELTDGLDEDAEGIRFWSLADIKQAPDVLTGLNNPSMDLTLPDSLPHPSGYFVFADVLIWSHFYLISLASHSMAGRIVGVGCGEWWHAADSFSQFAELYLADPSNADFIGYRGRTNASI
jgi:hypothetical protein